jgi:hypothetical protein
MLRISEITKTYWKPPLCYSYVGSLKFPVGGYPRFTWNSVSLLLRHFHGSKVAWNPIFSLGNNSLDGLNRVEWPLFHKDRWHNHKRQKIIGECLIHYGKGLRTSAWYSSDFSHLRRGSNVESFDKSWGIHQVICFKSRRFVRWCYVGLIRILLVNFVERPGSLPSLSGVVAVFHFSLQ